MKKTIIALFTGIILVSGALAQGAKDTKVVYNYKMYPVVKYDQNINSFFLQVNFLQDFLAGKAEVSYDTTTHCSTYTFEQNSNIMSLFAVKGLEKSQDNGLKIVINYNSTGNADKVVADYDKKTGEIVNAENALVLVGKMKDKLVFAEVQIYEGTTLLDSKKFDWKSDYKNEYIEYYNDKTKKKPYEGYSQKIKFADNNAKAAYFIGGSVYFTYREIENYLNSRIGFTDKMFNMQVSTAKGKKMDYSDLDAAKDKAIGAIKDVNKDALKECVTVWLETAKKADYANKKAQYNAEIAAAMYINCLNACLVTEDFDLFATIESEINANKANFKNSWINDMDDVSKEIQAVKKNRQINAHRL